MNKYINKKKAILLVAVLSIYVVIITPLLVVNLQKKQELRGRAQNTTTATVTPGQTCGNVPADIMLIIDRSGSMGKVNKLDEAKQAAQNFIDVIAQNSGNRIGLVSFSTTATLNSGLTTDFTSVKNRISYLYANGSTCHECAIVKANQEITANGRTGVKKVVVMLTDGQANYIIGGTQQMSDPTIPEAKALDAVKNGFNTSKTVFFTIGFGVDGSTGTDGYNRAFLESIATLTGGKHYYPAPGELQGVYDEISQLIGKGLLGGFVFNDTNGNGIYDTSEAKLSNINIQLNSSSSLIKSAVTDSTGYYTISGICDGNYTLKQILKSGWIQTLPADPNGYPITITNGSQYTNKNFGTKLAPPTPTSTPKPTATPTPKPTNTPTPTPTPTPWPTATPTPKPTATPTPYPLTPTSCPAPTAPYCPNGTLVTVTPTPTECSQRIICIPFTPTPTSKPTSTPTTTIVPTATPTTNPTPAATVLDITVYEHGIWNSGDNTNPTDTSLSNKNPLHKKIDSDVELFNSDNQLVGQGRGQLTYNTSSGNFQGTVGIYPNTISTGKYYLKVKTSIHLKRLVPGIITVTAGQKNTVPAATLVTGDSNNDNQLNILDYNSLLDCYSDLSAAAACDPDKKVTTDFNDDGFVNQIDYNLFLRELATQPGQ